MKEKEVLFRVLKDFFAEDAGYNMFSLDELDLDLLAQAQADALQSARVKGMNHAN